MARLIDAERLSEHKYVGVEYDRALDMGIPASANNIFAFKCGWNDALDSVERFAPTVDAVEVVRCKNCRWFENDGWGYGNCYRRNVDFLRMSDNGFCSYGERREDGKTGKG